MAGFREQEDIAKLTEQFQQFTQMTDPFSGKTVSSVKDLVQWYEALTSHQGLQFPAYTIPKLTTTEGKELGLGKPLSFDGTSRKYQSWITSVNNYLNLNRHIYNTNERNIGFTLSFMMQGPAVHFTKNYLQDCTTAASDIYLLDMWTTFLLELRCDNFRKGLNNKTTEWVLCSGKIPKTVQDWIDTAVKAQTAKASLGMYNQNLTGEDKKVLHMYQDEGTSPASKKHHDPYAMDINHQRKSTPYQPPQKRKPFCFQEVRKEFTGKCFNCRKKGHPAFKCTQPKKAQSSVFQEVKSKYTQDELEELKKAFASEHSDF
ncbi:hypothetical protein EDD16DRAFT_1714954 [Pisolithus croceorrhizus]|nr:hypothetical protein EDD16DRAFT_1714954 [Pisolithus croceorrhizus]